MTEFSFFYLMHAHLFFSSLPQQWDLDRSYRLKTDWCPQGELRSCYMILLHHWCRISLPSNRLSKSWDLDCRLSRASKLFQEQSITHFNSDNTILEVKACGNNEQCSWPESEHQSVLICCLYLPLRIINPLNPLQRIVLWVLQSSTFCQQLL